jgi:hypothetical protein
MIAICIIVQPQLPAQSFPTVSRLFDAPNRPATGAAASAGLTASADTQLAWVDSAAWGRPLLARSAKTTGRQVAKDAYE